MMKTDPATVTRLLRQGRAGSKEAVDRLASLVYDELHRIAHRFMKAERQGHTLQTTALVHEAYQRLAGADLKVEDRVHFMSLAASTMRRILVDHARAHGAAKRGGDGVRVTLEEAMAISEDSPHYLMDLDAALTELARQDPRKGEVVELFFFGGLTRKEIAELLDLSEPTIQRDLRMARAWLRSRMNR